MPTKINIFLIEDDADDREFLEVALQDEGVPYDLQCINRGDLIIPWLETCKRLPDLIIMDLNLPKLHGREVICKIKENKKFSQVPFLVLTTSSSTLDRDYCINKGADRFFSKPSDPEGFKELIRAVVELAAKSKVSR